MDFESKVLNFLKDMARKEEEIEYLIINMFKTELENNGVKLGKIKREYVIDDIGVLRIGYILPIMYYEEGEKIYLFLSKNYADYSSIEQILIREKILREKMKKDVFMFLVAYTIPKKYYDLATKMGIKVITENIIE
ncbi:MAG: hypothetical protein QW232_07265 [Saccharolobus sp.]|uniref:hypothetical protein n=1 Tax=Saccharolobus sp. TaxID=2100761 RepID=UPI0031633FF2